MKIAIETQEPKTIVPKITLIKLSTQKQYCQRVKNVDQIKNVYISNLNIYNKAYQ